MVHGQGSLPRYLAARGSHSDKSTPNPVDFRQFDSELHTQARRLLAGVIHREHKSELPLISRVFAANRERIVNGYCRLEVDVTCNRTFLSQRLLAVWLRLGLALLE